MSSARSGINGYPGRYNVMVFVCITVGWFLRSDKTGTEFFPKGTSATGLECFSNFRPIKVAISTMVVVFNKIFKLIDVNFNIKGVKGTKVDVFGRFWTFLDKKSMFLDVFGQKWPILS